MGHFEALSGNQLLFWLEVEAYGSGDWVVICPGYEKANKMTINKDTAEYKDYRKVICEMTVKKLLGLSSEGPQATVTAN